MSEEHLRLLEALGALARDEQLELKELAALCDPERREQALRRAGDVPGFDRDLAHATQPLSAQSQARIAQRVQEALQANSLPERARGLQPQTAAVPANQNAAEPLAAVKRKRPSARAQPRRAQPTARPNPLRTWVSVALPLLAAAAAVLLWLDPGQAPVRLPEFSLDVRASSGSHGQPAGALDGPVVLPQAGALELEILPDSEYHRPLDLQVQLQRAGANVDLPAQVEQSTHGVLRARIDRASLPARGRAKLLITLTLPGAAPPVAAREPDELRGRGWQAWLLEVQLPGP